MANYTVVAEVGNRIEVIKRDDRRNYYAYYRNNVSVQCMPSLKTRDKKEAVNRAQTILRSLEEGTHDRIEEVRDSKHVTFRAATDDYLAGASGTDKSIHETRLRLNFICGDLDNQRRYPRDAWGDRPIQAIKAKDIDSPTAWVIFIITG